MFEFLSKNYIVPFNCLKWQVWSASSAATCSQEKTKQDSVWPQHLRQWNLALPVAFCRQFEHSKGFLKTHDRVGREIKADKWGPVLWHTVIWLERKEQDRGDVRSERHRRGKKGKTWRVNRGRQPEDVSVGEAVGGRGGAWSEGARLPGEGPAVSDSPPGPPSGPTLGTANLPWHA